MVSVKLLVLSILACYIHNTNSQCTQNFAGGPIPSNINYANAFNNPGYGMAQQLSYANPNGIPNGIGPGIQSAGNFGGLGNGNIAIAGELPVAGNTVLSGAVPVLGAVSFGGTVPAGGVVSIAGTYGCGCNFS